MMNKLTTLTLLVLFSANSYSWDTKFGYNGENGRNGANGVTGASGKDIVISSNGTKQSYSLVGANGTNGGDAEYGYPATSCNQYQPNNDVYGASGGDGGSGGNAGHGGDGGSIVVQYDNINTLRNIFVDSSPGLGALGGKGAEGAAGCRCSVPNWTRQFFRTAWRTVYVRECRVERLCDKSEVNKDRGDGRPGGNGGPGGNHGGGRPGGNGPGPGPGPITPPAPTTPGAPGAVCRDEKICSNVPRQEAYQQPYFETFHCQDGRYGSSGRDGSNGSNGSLGKVTLINQLKPLAPVKPSAQATFADLEAGLVMSNYIWEEKVGARTLFKAGSVIDDNFTAYAGRIDQPIKLEWAVPYRTITDFANVNVQLNLVGTKVESSVVDSGFLFSRQSRLENGVQILSITGAVKKSELTNMKMVQINGTDDNTYLEVEDLGGYAEAVTTRFYIDGDFDKASDNRDYNQFVEPQFVERTGNIFRILLGKLPLKKNYFKPGKSTDFELTIVRNFGQSVVKIGRFVIEKKKLGTNSELQIRMKDIKI